VVVNALAEDRPVIVFDNTGLGESSGTTPDNFAQMAADAESFITALGFTTVDLLGYSLGGMLAQILAAEHPKLVRKVLLVGTAPQGGGSQESIVPEKCCRQTNGVPSRGPSLR
jgi:pimeloyl-ACP methyl ester carboxylesterase